MTKTDGSGLRVNGRAREVVLLAADAAACAAALWIALQLRFDGEVPPRFLAVFERTLPILVFARLAANLLARIHRWSFRNAGLDDAAWVVAAAAAGSLVYGLAAEWLAPPGMPRTVYALEFFLSATAFGLLRFGPRLALRWRGQRARRRSGAPRALIVGTGGEAGLLAHDLRRSHDAPYDLVGFVCEGDPAKIGVRIEGRPILGLVDELPALIRRCGVSTVLLADSTQSAARIRAILDMCAGSQARFKIVPASFGWLDRRISAAMLDDLAPEDLLPRDAVAFDPAELRALAAGRRALVTGAGGSIGGEICRQLARYGARQVVMVDLNENELYLGARRLAEEFPALDVRAEVADVRDQPRMQALGARYRPQDVFHAAAHKHVPLLEVAPGEAVKNNVFGTLNVVRMAVTHAAERFVFISTDKAVKPSSVMGATKRVAELVVRAAAHGTRTQLTCVRFGNVLGSAGSVVPIFRQQIARGGPVTVTHPECTRFFMTIPEAVGLVLLAGLAGYGELCVLDMGEPLRIAALARHMITLAGHVPGEDIPIVFTGLRPGEKLREELLTEEEERSQTVRDRIRVTQSPPAPPDLVRRLERLRQLADGADDAAILAELRVLVPTYATPSAVARPPAAERPTVRTDDRESA
jgi:FlaA1/EpsC-like NDP-sugar epimerase